MYGLGGRERRRLIAMLCRITFTMVKRSNASAGSLSSGQRMLALGFLVIVDCHLFIQLFCAEYA